MMKILVMRYRFIGDMILSVPFLRNLRRAYPDAVIDMLVSPNSGEVIENCPYVNNFIFFDTKHKHKYENGREEKKSFFYYAALLRKQKYNKVYVLKRSFSSAVLAYLTGAPERIGFDTEHRGFLLSKKVKYDTNKHESLCFLDVLEADGVKIKDTYLENWVKDENIEKVKQLLKAAGIKEGEKYAAVNAAASNPYKMRDINDFAEITEYLSNEKGLQVIFIGAQCDYSLYENMHCKSKLKIPPVNLCGKLTMQDSLALIKGAEFVLGNDSGCLHTASSVNTPVIGLYGPMPFEKWKALGGNNILLKADLDCMPCSLKKKCPNDKACMKAVSIETIKKAADTMLSR